ncbi:MAG: transcriptional regulator GcvA [Neptuniibacter sp.]
MMNFIHLFFLEIHIRRLPPLNALRSFEAAARLGSFNKAAEELFVTPSAISHQVKALEDFLGLELFQRVKRRVKLTPPGERYLISIQSALDDIDDATRKLQSVPNTGAVNLSVAPAFLTRWLVPHMTRFQVQHPDVELRLTASLKQIDLRYSDMDMAIFFGEGTWEGVTSHLLREVTIVPLCSPALIAKSGKISAPEDLLQHTLINVSKRDHEWPELLRVAGVKDTTPKKSMTFSSTSLALGAAMEGLGIVLGDKHLAERELKYGQLILPYDVSLETNKSFYLAYETDRPLSTSMQFFRDWILDEMQQEIPDNQDN